MSFKLEIELRVERLSCTNSPAVFWPKKKITGSWVLGFNLSPWCVRLWVRVVRWRVRLHR